MAGTLNTRRWAELAPLVDRALDAGPGGVAAIAAEVRARDPTLADLLQAFLGEMQAASDEGFMEQAVAPAMASAVAHENLANRKLGTTTLVKPIADGGMGQVWLGLRDTVAQQQQVAVKLLSHLVVNPVQRERFARECKTLAVLRHPHIARLIETGVSTWGQPYLVLELVQGLRIDEGFDQRKLTVQQRVQHFITLLDAVQHAHQHLVVHRDIKPANVLFSAEGQVKLLDFGIAKLLSDEPLDATVTLRANAMLTPGYAAPEQWLGQPVTMATDVYALGVLLYVLLTGRHPFVKAGDTQKQAEQATLQAVAPRMSALQLVDAVAQQRGVGALQLRQQLRGDLDRIVAKAMHREPALRYANAAAFADDLRRYLDHRPVLARPPRFTYLLAKFVRRQRVPLALGTVAVTAFVTVGTHALQQRSHALENASRVATVDGLLKSIFRGMSPNVAGNRHFSAEELLGRAQGFLAENPGLDEPTKRQMQVRMADLYSDVGAFTSVIRTLDVELATATTAKDQAAQIAALRRLADAHIKLHDVDAAGRHLDQLEAALRSREKPEPLAQAWAQMLRGEWLWQQRLYARADEAMAAAQAFSEGAPGRAPAPVELRSRIAHVRGKLGNALGQYRQALVHLQRAYALEGERGNDGVADQLGMVRDLARAEAFLGRFAQARKLLEPALRDLDARIGFQHPVAMDTAVALATVSLRQGRFDEVQLLLARIEKADGTERAPLLIFARQLAAYMKLYQGDARTSASDLQELLTERKKRYPSPNLTSERLRSLLGGAQLHLGLHGEALETLRLAHERQVALVGEKHVSVANTKVLLGCALARSGDLSGSQTVWLQAHAVLQTELGPEHRDTLAAAAYLSLLETREEHTRKRSDLAVRLSQELGWQHHAAQLTQWLQNGAAPKDWSKLPVVL